MKYFDLKNQRGGSGFGTVFITMLFTSIFLMGILVSLDMYQNKNVIDIIVNEIQKEEQELKTTDKK